MPGLFAAAIGDADPGSGGFGHAGDFDQELSPDRFREALLAVGGDDEAGRAPDDQRGEGGFEIVIDGSAAAGPAEDGQAVDHDLVGKRGGARRGDRESA